jgi:2-polyprenyl-6-methoxyphenol hydroxylase-like FAD-dependent oxidoreductase
VVRIDKAVIVGGGIGGPAVGLALRRAGVEVEVHEKYGDFQGRATGFSIWAYAIKRLMGFGFDRERLERIGREMLHQDIYNESGERMMSLPVGKVSATVEAPSMDVDRRRLQEEMVDLLGDGVYRFGSEAVAVEQDGSTATVRFADGTSASGDLVIAADGIHSVVRDGFNDPPDFKVSHSDIHEGVSDFEHPWLHGGHHVQVWGRGRRAGIGAVGEGRARWFFGGILKPDDPDIDRAEIARRADGLPDIVSGVVEATVEQAIGRARVAHAYPVANWRQGRVVLLGDAAHTLSPYAGMGACSTIEDAAQLAEALESSPSVEEALDGYAERRKAKTRAIEKRGRVNEVMMLTPSPTLGRLRDWMLEQAGEDRQRKVATEMATGE